MTVDGSSLSTDSPRTDPAEDRLGRLPVASVLARILLRDDSQSIVAGLYGPWGSGKTSVLNFVEAELTRSDSVVVIRFEPWLFHGVTPLVASFFETVASETELRLKGSTKKKFGKAVRSIGHLMSFASIGLGPVGFAGGPLERLGAELAHSTLKEDRDAVGEALRNAGVRVVVVIDDIDRLASEEIALLFKLVKLVGDLPNISYLLAFDLDVVAGALTGYQPAISGSSFVDKIVQVPIHLPPADSVQLRRLALSRLEEVISGAAIELTEQDVYRLRVAFDRGVQPHIGTPRVATRLGNAFAVSLPILAKEVNAVDLVLMESIRIVFPTLYDWIRSHKRDVLGLDLLRTGDTRTAEERFQKECDELWKELGPLTDGAKTLLGELFPRLGHFVGGMGGYGAEWGKIWAKDRRIASTEFFDLYFQYGVSRSDVSEDLFAQLLSHCSNRDLAAASEMLESLLSANAEVAIAKIRRVESELEGGAAAVLAVALADSADSLPDPPGAFFGFTPMRQAAISTTRLIADVDASSRNDLIQDLVGRTPSLPYAAELVRWMRAADEGEADSSEASGGRRLNDEQLSRLETALAERIAASARQGVLWDQWPEDALALYKRWKEAFGSEEIRTHLLAAIADAPGSADDLLRIAADRAWSLDTGIPSRQIRVTTVEALASLIDIDVLLDAIRSLHPSAVATADEHGFGFDSEADQLASQLAFAVNAWRARNPEAGDSESSDGIVPSA